MTNNELKKPIAVLVEDESDIAAFEDFTLEDAGAAAAAPKQQPPAEEKKPAKAEEPAAAPSSAPSETRSPAAETEGGKYCYMQSKMMHHINQESQIA